MAAMPAININQPNADELFAEVEQRINEASLALARACEAAAVLARGGNLPGGITGTAATLDLLSFQVLEANTDVYFCHSQFLHRRAKLRGTTTGQWTPVVVPEVQQ